MTTPPKRAPKGSISANGVTSGVKMPVRLPALLVYQVRAAAKREALSVAEWVRRAIEEALP